MGGDVHMSMNFHRKGEARRAVELRQMNASAVRRGLPALIIAAEKREERRSK
jgi:hypothetical protein